LEAAIANAQYGISKGLMCSERDPETFLSILQACPEYHDVLIFRANTSMSYKWDTNAVMTRDRNGTLSIADGITEYYYFTR
jgi:hypothetical protein